MIFLLIFSSISPLPTSIVTANTSAFPGVPTYSVTVDPTNTGTVEVTMRDEGYSVVLHKHKDNDSQEGPVSFLTNYTVGTKMAFPNKVEPGKYNIRATKDGNTIISADIFVKPQKLTNITSNEARTLVVAGVRGSKVNLYEFISGNYKPITNYNLVTSGSTFTFNNLMASSNYVITQEINGVESEYSDNTVTVRPNKVTLEPTASSGPANNAGELLITNTKSDNKLELFRVGDTKTRIETAISTTHPFDELKAGVYTVIQTENGVKSHESDPVTIKDEQVPFITLNQGSQSAKYEISGEAEDDKYTVKRWTYEESGYSINYKDKTYTGTTAKTFCTDPNIENGQTDCEPILNISITSEPTKLYEETTIDNIKSWYTPPGIYTITYVAKDHKIESLKHTVTRNFTVYPNKLLFSKKDTDPNIENDTTGDITVYGVYEGAKLSLVQRLDDGSEIDVLTEPVNLNKGKYIFENVPVGNNYYVYQEVNGVKSDSTDQISILDSTPPVLNLKGEKEITIEAGDPYIDEGATATDNITPSLELNVTSTGSVNTAMPGVYKITYNVTDKAGNKAIPITRTIIVKPRPVIAIGGIAATGEIGVNDIFPGIVNRETTLYLYKFEKDANGQEKFSRVASQILDNNELTFVLRKYGPGRYYVTQTVNGQESRQSNIVEIVDTDRPYITLNGLETVRLVYGESLMPYYDGTNFIDPGANADDYLEADTLNLKATLVNPAKAQIAVKDAVGKEISLSSTALPVPGIYTITYTAIAPERQSSAVQKQRIIELAPPKIIKVSAGEPGSGEVKVINGLFKHDRTIAKLYNTYGQEVASQVINNSEDVTFENVPAGIGYYVTQTINGLESAPSVSVNVGLFEEAPITRLISSFEFPSLNATGMINHTTGTITVTVPNDTDVTKLSPVIKTNNDKLNMVSPQSGVAQDFTLPVKYILSPATDELEEITKTYTVTVVKATASSNIWKGVVQKNILIGANSHYTLTAAEKVSASEKGIAFLSNDLSVFVPAPNVKESKVPTLSIQQPAISTIYTANDPSWATSITTPMEIEWGGESSFYQPIEVELNNPSNKKVFSKLVRNTNNELVAIIQPSYPTAGKTVGIVSEPGLYALIDKVEQPYIQNLGNGRYQVHTITPGAAIYYTTNSQHISYEKAASLVSGNYLLNKSGINLDQWTRVSDYKTLQISGNELYAIAVKDQIISPVSSEIVPNYSSWSKDIKQVEATKVWNVKFNAKVERKALYNNSIYVTDDSTGAVIPTTLRIGEDGQSINVVPATPYDRNKYYTLWVSKEIKGNTINNQFLVRPTKLTFTVK